MAQLALDDVARHASRAGWATGVDVVHTLAAGDPEEAESPVDAPGSGGGYLGIVAEASREHENVVARRAAGTITR